MKSLREHSLRISQIFLYLMMFTAVITFFISYLKTQIEPGLIINASQFLDKIAILAACMGLIQFNRKKKNAFVNYITAVVISIVLFEVYAIFRAKYTAYIWFLLLHTYSDNLCLFTGISHKVFTYIHVTTIVYHIVRIIIFSYLDSSFPLFDALALSINFINLDSLNLYTLKTYFQILKDQENMTNDFNSIIDIIPAPTIFYKCDLNYRSILRVNRSASSMFTEGEIKDIIITSSILMKLNISSFLYHNKDLSLHCVPLKTKIFGENTYIISILDNTEVVEKEKQIAMENAKWLFVNSINHQIRTPLSGIESALLILETSILENMAKDLGCIKRYIKIAYHCIKDLRHIVDDSVLFCEDKGNLIEIKNEPFKIEEICNELINEFTVETYSKDIKFIVEQHVYQNSLISDKKRIMHVLFTLISNAFKYTLKGEILVKHKYVPFRQDAGTLHFTVSDTGIGMGQMDLKSSKSTFQYSDQIRKEEKTSTGIGLYIAHRLCEIMKGSLVITSSSTGTTIKACFEVGSRVESPANIISFNISFSHEKDKKVLLVDDNVTNLFVLKSMLNKLGIKSDEAHNGKEAVEKYEKVDYGLILMDINMPVMNGYEASKLIKGYAQMRKRGVIIVAVSAQDEPKSVEELNKFGIDYWVEKPLRCDLLSRCVKEAGYQIA